jgi:hypothetical protein
VNKVQKVSYNKTDFDIPVLDADGGYRFELSELEPKGVSCPTGLQKTTLVDFLTPYWNPRQFKTPRLPILCGSVVDMEFFSQPADLRILDMPIKFPWTDYRVPKVCSQFLDVIKKIAAQDLGINGVASRQYAYLTIDQSFVKKGQMQRRPGLHVDGFQGARIKDKEYIDHSYVISDRSPTVFYSHGFDVDHLDEAVHNFFLEFDEQADESKTWRPEPFEICFINAYQVHRAAEATEDGYRTFFRLSYTFREFDRLGNTHNPLFDYNWEMVPRNTQTTLVKASGRRF